MAKIRHIANCVRDHDLNYVATAKSSKHDFSVHVLDHLSGDFDFTWNCVLPHGRSNGILPGIQFFSMYLLTILAGEFHIKFHLIN